MHHVGSTGNNIRVEINVVASLANGNGDMYKYAIAVESVWRIGGRSRCLGRGKHS